MAKAMRSKAKATNYHYPCGCRWRIKANTVKDAFICAFHAGMSLIP